MASYGFLFRFSLPRSGPLLIRAEAPAAHTPRTRFVARLCTKIGGLLLGFPKWKFHGIPWNTHKIPWKYDEKCDSPWNSMKLLGALFSDKQVWRAQQFWRTPPSLFVGVGRKHHLYPLVIFQWRFQSQEGTNWLPGKPIPFSSRMSVGKDSTGEWVL